MAFILTWYTYEQKILFAEFDLKIDESGKTSVPFGKMDG